jgi:hypothetical protein
MLNGAGTPLPHSVSGVSNISLTTMATSSVGRAKQHIQHIRSQSGKKLKARKVRVLPEAGLRLGSVSRRHSKAGFSRRSSRQIHQRINSLMQLHASNPAQQSSVTRVVSAISRGVSSGFFRLSAISGGRRCLFGHYGVSPRLTWNHLREEPF